MSWRDLPRTRLSQAFAPPHGAAAGLCVLASGSSGNCSVLAVLAPAPDGGPPRPERVLLLDAGLSPARTRALLAERGIPLRAVDDVVLTHLDQDHFHSGWRSVSDCRATLRMHRRHLGRAQREGMLLARNEPFTDAVALGDRTTLLAALGEHDELGVATLRFCVRDAAGVCHLGFATDLGRMTDALVRHLRGVDVLAVESNYCPRMQAESARPAFLKQRITGGRGHLSNEECARAVQEIGPRRHAVFLHLSRECNRPERVAALHEGAAYAWSISTQDEPTPWVWLMPRPADEPGGDPRADGVPPPAEGRIPPRRTATDASQLSLFAAPPAGLDLGQGRGRGRGPFNAPPGALR